MKSFLIYVFFGKRRINFFAYTLIQEKLRKKLLKTLFSMYLCKSGEKIKYFKEVKPNHNNVKVKKKFD